MEHLKIEQRDGRWWAESVPGFDGTAQGYGYKTRDGLVKAYLYCADEVKQKRKKSGDKLRVWLKANKDIEEMLHAYFDVDSTFYRLKAGRKSNYRDFIDSLPPTIDSESIAERLKPLSRQFKALERKVGARIGSKTGDL